MRQVLWVLALAVAAGLAYWLWLALRRYRARKGAEAARMAEFLARAGAFAAAKPAADLSAAAAASRDAPASPGAGATGGEAPALAQQRLLFDAAARAGEAGEPALAIQLYARLIARYPASALAEQARAAVETQKKRLAKP